MYVFNLTRVIGIIRWIIAVSMHLKKTANLRMNRKEGRRLVNLDIFFYSIFILQHGCGSYFFPISILHVLQVGYEARRSRGPWTSAFYISKSKLHLMWNHACTVYKSVHNCCKKKEHHRHHDFSFGFFAFNCCGLWRVNYFV